MKKIIPVFLLLLLVSIICKPDEYKTNRPIKLENRPTPNQVNFKNGIFTSDVDLFTGTPILKLDLFKYSGVDLNFDLSLTHTSRAVRTSDISGWIGLNWSLSCDYSITREIRGIPDNPDKKGLVSENYEKYSKYDVSSNENDMKDWLKWSNNRDKDTEPDIFHFNIDNASGKIVFAKSGYKVLSSIEGIKVKFVEKESDIYAFILIMPDNTKYVFGNSNNAIEKTKTITYEHDIESVVYSYGYTHIPCQNLLYKSSHPYNNDGKAIEIEDSRTKYIYGDKFVSTKWYITKIERGSEVIFYNYSNSSYEIDFYHAPNMTSFIYDYNKRVSTPNNFDIYHSVNYAGFKPSEGSVLNPSYVINGNGKFSFSYQDKDNNEKFYAHAIFDNSSDKYFTHDYHYSVRLPEQRIYANVNRTIQKKYLLENININNKSSIVFKSKQTKADMSNDYILDNIQIKNYLGAVVRNFDFKYDNKNTTHYISLLENAPNCADFIKSGLKKNLKSVFLSKIIENDQLVYSFIYNNSGLQNSRTSLMKNKWGYSKLYSMYYKAFSLMAGTYETSNNIGCGFSRPYTGFGANNYGSGGTASYGTLATVKFPTGGYIDYEYNNYSNGTTVKKIKKYSSSGVKAEETAYSYDIRTFSSSTSMNKDFKFVIKAHPKYEIHDGGFLDQSFRELIEDKVDYGYFKVSRSESFNNLIQFNGSYFYSKQTTVQKLGSTNEGKIVYRYFEPIINPYFWNPLNPNDKVQCEKYSKWDFECPGSFICGSRDKIFPSESMNSNIYELNSATCNVIDEIERMSSNDNTVELIDYDYDNLNSGTVYGFKGEKIRWFVKGGDWKDKSWEDLNILNNKPYFVHKEKDFYLYNKYSINYYCKRLKKITKSIYGSGDLKNSNKLVTDYYYNSLGLINRVETSRSDGAIDLNIKKYSGDYGNDLEHCNTVKEQDINREDDWLDDCLSNAGSDEDRRRDCYSEYNRTINQIEKDYNACKAEVNGDPSIYLDMFNNDFKAFVIEDLNYIKRSGESKLVSATFNKYNKFGNAYRVESVWKAQKRTGFRSLSEYFVDNPEEIGYRKVSEVTQYDSHGNILETYDPLKDVYSAIKMGYDDTYPILVAENTRYSSISSYEVGNSIPSSIKGKAVAYTYKPGVGVLTETDNLGNKKTYKYDELNNLIETKDKDGNILSALEYKYATVKKSVANTKRYTLTISFLNPLDSTYELYDSTGRIERGSLLDAPIVHNFNDKFEGYIIIHYEDVQMTTKTVQINATSNKTIEITL